MHTQDEAHNQTQVCMQSRFLSRELDPLSAATNLVEEWVHNGASSFGSLIEITQINKERWKIGLTMYFRLKDLYCLSQYVHIVLPQTQISWTLISESFPNFQGFPLQIPLRFLCYFVWIEHVEEMVPASTGEWDEAQRSIFDRCILDPEM